jgi:tRNA (guanine37-N1)-methyltransferase
MRSPLKKRTYSSLNSNIFFYSIVLHVNVLVKCFGVNPKKTERVRQALLELDLILNEFPVVRTEERVLIPVKEEADPSQLKGIGAKIEVLETDLQPRKKRPRSFKEMLDIDEELMELVPSSFDIVGDIALIKLPEELHSHCKEIGDALRSFNRNIRTVAMDHGVIGEFRVRDLEIISGNKDLETTHVENNLRFKLDPSKVYFSPRLATERMRIASMVESEDVLDMFAGVGPFALTIARHGNAHRVVGIDLNPESIRYFSNNILLNSLDDRVEAHLGDARDISVIFGPYDRVVMNLPHSSLDFFDTALSVVESGMIHLYRIVEEGGMMNDVQKLIAVASDLGREMSITGTREVHNFSPSQSMMVFDIKVNG